MAIATCLNTLNPLFNRVSPRDVTPLSDTLILCICIINCKKKEREARFHQQRTMQELGPQMKFVSALGRQKSYTCPHHHHHHHQVKAVFFLRGWRRHTQHGVKVEE